MRTKMRAGSAVQILAALIVATACGSAPSTGPAYTSVLDDHFGFLVGNEVRREGASTPLFVLGIPSVDPGNSAGVVSPDGRHLAFLENNQLHVMDIAPGAQPRTLFTITAKEGGMYLAWSSDSTGLVVGVTGPVPNAGGEGLPAYTKLRIVDATGGTPRDVISVPNAALVPLAWDRQAHLISAYESYSFGAGSYDVVSETGTLKRTNTRDGLFWLAASQDGRNVYGHGDPNNVVRVWPLASYQTGVDLRATTDEHIATVAWRPGTAEVGVLFHGDRLELWDASGARRTVVLPPAPTSADRYATLAFRLDGKAVVITRQSGVEGNTDVYAVAVDLTSGRSVVLSMVGGGPFAGTSVRIGS